MSRKNPLAVKRSTRNEKNQGRNDLKKWLEVVNKQKFVHDEIDDLSSSDDEKFEEIADFKELQKPLKKLLRRFPDTKIKGSTNIECEWDKCGFETNGSEEMVYIDHVHSHFSCSNSEVKEFEIQLKCFWDLCPFTCSDSQEFVRHLDFHCYHSILKSFGFGLVSTLSLPVCQKFGSKNRNKIPVKISCYFCYWFACGQKFNKFHEYVQHVNDHIQNISVDGVRSVYPNVKMINIKVTCQWDGCNKEMLNIFELKRHVKNRHTIEKMIGCANCGELYKCKSLFIDHLMRQSVSHRNYQCRDCFKEFPTEKLLKEHSRSHINKYQCAFCGLSCQKESALARHIRYRHTNSKPFECSHEDCSYQGKSKSDLKSHMNKHKEGSDQYKCEVFNCLYSSRTLAAYKRHYAKIHLQEPQTYACHECEKKYMRGNLLSRHLISSHGYSLPPGHSRFLFKLCNDGYLRLQTKRRENLKETTVKITTAAKDANASYEIDMTEIANEPTNINLKMRKVSVVNPKASAPAQPTSTIAKSKDISEFAVVKTYNIKK